MSLNNPNSCPHDVYDLNRLISIDEERWSVILGKMEAMTQSEDVPIGSVMNLLRSTYRLQLSIRANTHTLMKQPDAEGADKYMTRLALLHLQARDAQMSLAAIIDEVFAPADRALEQRAKVVLRP